MLALHDISLGVHAGTVHALIGPNGAGKTTLLRILSGLLTVDSGIVRLMGIDVTRNLTALRGRIGLIPSGDRTFYLRLSGAENLAFFGRLHGLPRREAFERAEQTLIEVGLADVGSKRVGLYSHGMQKRLSVARALLAHPPVLLVDEATHDLDPEGAVRVRNLVRRAADDGAAVIWATQRLDEIRAFAETVTLLDHGQTRFNGAVSDLMEQARPRHYLLRLSGNGTLPLDEHARLAVAPIGTIGAVSNGSVPHYRLTLSGDGAIGDAVVQLESAGIRVLTCRQEQSEIEEAFLALTNDRTT